MDMSPKDLLSFPTWRALSTPACLCVFLRYSCTCICTYMLTYAFFACLCVQVHFVSASRCCLWFHAGVQLGFLSNRVGRPSLHKVKHAGTWAKVTFSQITVFTLKSGNFPIHRNIETWLLCNNPGLCDSTNTLVIQQHLVACIIMVVLGVRQQKGFWPLGGSLLLNKTNAAFSYQKCHCDLKVISQLKFRRFINSYEMIAY